MIIDLANLGIAAKAIVQTFDLAEIDLDGESVRLIGPLVFNGEIQRTERKGHLSGAVEGDVSIDCTRCLEPIERHLMLPFRAIFVDPGDEEVKADVEISDEALDESIVAGGRIDLAEVVREQVLLAMPEQAFCREGCRGLCPKCGSNLNLIDCKCADDEIDPRWAALKNLK